MIYILRTLHVRSVFFFCIQFTLERWVSISVICKLYKGRLETDPNIYVSKFCVAFSMIYIIILDEEVNHYKVFIKVTVILQVFWNKKYRYIIKWYTSYSQSQQPTFRIFTWDRLNS